MEKVKYRVVDLFSGAGGLSCGLGMSGFRSVLANELVPCYAETYQANHPQAVMITGDIRGVPEGEIKAILGGEEGGVDLVAGGPPCQGFSVNAPIRSLDDERNHLFKEFIRVVSCLKPKAILIENVPGIISMGKGTVVEQIYKELDALGYSVDHRILFAGHYGVPQMRFRTVFIGIRKSGVSIRFPQPQHDAKAVANFTGAKKLCLKTDPLFNDSLKKPTTVWNALSDLPEITPGVVCEGQKYASDPSCDYQDYLREGSDSLNNHYCNRLADINLERLKHIPQGGSWRDVPHELLPKGLQRARRSDHTKRYGRLAPDGLCSTVLTKCDPHWGSFFHPTQDRVISVREAARIQSFPDVYKFMGKTTQQYEQVGNAVPPLLGKAIGAEIRNMIEEVFYA